MLTAKKDEGRMRRQARELYRTIMMPEIFYPCAFIFLLNATPSTGSAWFYFYSSKPPLGLGCLLPHFSVLSTSSARFSTSAVSSCSKSS